MSRLNIFRSLLRAAHRGRHVQTPLNTVSQRFFSLSRRAIKVNGDERPPANPSDMKPSGEEPTFYVAEPQKKSFIRNLLTFYVTVPHNVGAFPLAAILIFLVVMKIAKDLGERSTYKSALKSSPVIETALGILAKAPFYADLVGVNPETGAPNVPVVTKISGSVPLTSFISHFRDRREHVLELQMTVDGRTISVEVVARNFADRFYDADGIFRPLGINNNSSFAQQFNTSAVATTHITRIAVTSSLNPGGYVIRFADDPEDPWVRLQAATYGRFLQVLHRDALPTYEATTLP